MSAFGLTAEAQALAVSDEQPFAVYAGNWPTMQLWVMLWPRWLMVSGFNGLHRTALDMNQVRSMMRLMRVKKAKMKQITDELLAMEDEALAALAELREFDS